MDIYDALPSAQNIIDFFSLYLGREIKADK